MTIIEKTDRLPQFCGACLEPHLWAFGIGFFAGLAVIVLAAIVAEFWRIGRGQNWKGGE